MFFLEISIILLISNKFLCISMMTVCTFRCNKLVMEIRQNLVYHFKQKKNFYYFELSRRVSTKLKIVRHATNKLCFLILIYEIDKKKILGSIYAIMMIVFLIMKCYFITFSYKQS